VGTHSEAPEQKPSRGFLWWGGLVVGMYIFGPGRAIRPDLMGAFVLCLTISAGICYSWHWVSRRKQRRSFIPYVIGLVLFVYVSVSPLMILDSATNPITSRSYSWPLGVVLSLVLLGLAYLLMFRGQKLKTGPIEGPGRSQS